MRWRLVTPRSAGYVERGCDISSDECSSAGDAQWRRQYCRISARCRPSAAIGRSRALNDLRVASTMSSVSGRGSGQPESSEIRDPRTRARQRYAPSAQAQTGDPLGELQLELCGTGSYNPRGCAPGPISESCGREVDVDRGFARVICVRYSRAARAARGVACVVAAGSDVPASLFRRCNKGFIDQLAEIAPSVVQPMRREVNAMVGDAASRKLAVRIFRTFAGADLAAASFAIAYMACHLIS